MTVKECVKTAAEMLNLDVIAAYLTASNPPALSASDARELEQLISCARAVTNEIACEYAQVLQTETLTANADGLIPFSACSKNMTEVISVSSGARKIPFRTYFGGIDVGAKGAYAVTYAYVPPVSALSDAFDFGNGKINPRNVAYGIAAEYCIRGGEASDAVLWDKRYKDSLQAALRRRREQRVLPRRWL